MAISPGNGGEELVGDAIPKAPPKPTKAKVDLSAPWYRPAKQYLRRMQWNADILHLLNRLPAGGGQANKIRYVGLPGQHYLDVLSMGRICHAKNLLIEYLGFRAGDGPGATAEHLSELQVLSNQTHFAQNSVTYPDNICNIGIPASVATAAIHARGPFDVVNLDVCGGVLHGDTTPLLSAIKYVLSAQSARPLPWLLFVTTAAKAQDIADDVIKKFFGAVTTNCERVGRFRTSLGEASQRLGVSADDCVARPGSLSQDGFLRFFTLALGKWLLANLTENNPRSTVTLRSVYSFRNTGRGDPEMLSLAFLISPVTGGADPTGLTTPGAVTLNESYAEGAVGLVSASLDGLLDLDQVWDAEPGLKAQIVHECEDLLRTIGVDDGGLVAWRERHGIVVV